MKIDGFVSRRAIRLWLDNYRELAAQDVIIDDMPKNSGAKDYDGICSRQLNQIMLNDAIKKLPPKIGACVVARWIKRWDLLQALTVMKISKDLYYTHCDEAIDLIYLQLNGTAVNYSRLINEIEKGLSPPKERTKKARQV